MVSTQANRATFIASLKQFMATYNFNGVDIDWEVRTYREMHQTLNLTFAQYPGADDRGGAPADGVNFASLVKEMRASFGGNYGQFL